MSRKKTSGKLSRVIHASEFTEIDVAHEILRAARYAEDKRKSSQPPNFVQFHARTEKTLNLHRRQAAKVVNHWLASGDIPDDCLSAMINHADTDSAISWLKNNAPTLSLKMKKQPRKDNPPNYVGACGMNLMEQHLTPNLPPLSSDDDDDADESAADVVFNSTQTQVSEDFSSLYIILFSTCDSPFSNCCFLICRLDISYYSINCTASGVRIGVTHAGVY